MEQSPLQPTPVGAFRFNTDSAKMEYYDGNQWVNISSDSPEVQTGGTRGISFKGNAPSNSTVIDYIAVETTGNAVDFGDKTSGREGAALGNRTRAVHHVGFQSPSPGAYVDTMEYVTVSSTGNTTDFGNSTDGTIGAQGTMANSTRGIWAGGYYNINTIDYITIAQTGNAVDFGDLSIKQRYMGCCASPTRGILSAGVKFPGFHRQIDYLTISTKGNTAVFGDLVDDHEHYFGGSNATRGVFMAGQNDAPAAMNIIEYVTIATLGNAIDFGDTSVTDYPNGTATSRTRAVNMGYNSSNTMDYVQIPTTGNAVDFGNATESGRGGGSASNGHGGLG